MHFGWSTAQATDRFGRRMEGEGARRSTNREDGSFSRTELGREIDGPWGDSRIARRRTRLQDDFVVDLRALGEEVVWQSWQRNGGKLPAPRDARLRLTSQPGLFTFSRAMVRVVPGGGPRPGDTQGRSPATALPGARAARECRAGACRR